MKKLLAIILAVAMCFSLGTAAFAAEDILLIAPAPQKGVSVTVTISDAGNLVLVQAPVSVTDLDEDGIVSINDALMAAHLAYYPGEAGYAYYVGDYGIAMDTLWGVTNGGSYMYYVNDIMPMSLGEAVNAGDSIFAYGFADLEGWSDQYTYFDKRTAEVTVGDTLELTLSAPDWSGNVLPVAGAEIVVDGAKTGVVTDENGKAAIILDKAGEHIVSAVSDTAVLVPPVCKVKVIPVVVDVTVTISDAGKLVLVDEPVSVTDRDEDGAVTINDALISAHAVYYAEGTAGYAYYVGDYGIAMDTLWGVTNGGSYMYYVNDIMPMSLGEAINAGDSIVAYGFADLEAWSDTYTYFDKRTAEVTAGDTLELTLSAPDWSGNVLPVAGAEIVVDGAKTGVVTDENGKAAVVIDKAGERLVSAVSETMVIVPPVCKITVGVAEADGEASRAFAVDMLYDATADTLVPGDFDAGFTDTDSPAFRWAAFNGIIEGYGNGKAGPLNKVTRQELATILWRYAKVMGIDVSVGENTNILSYNDAAEISEWAIPAMQWACGAGILNDTEGDIRPAGEVTRAQAAEAVAAVAALA